MNLRDEILYEAIVALRQLRQDKLVAGDKHWNMVNRVIERADNLPQAVILARPLFLLTEVGNGDE